MNSLTTNAARTQLNAASADPSAELVPATALARLVTVCLPHTSTDRLLPILRCVHLFEQGGSLWAEASDQYTAIRARSDVKAPEGFTALIDRDDCRAIVAAFKPARGSTLSLALTVTNDRLAVSVAEGMVKVGLDLTLTVQCQQGAYPPLARLYTQMAQCEVAPWLPTINAAYLRRLPDEPAQIRYSAQDRVIGFYANPDGGGEGDWAALIMPLRASNGDLAQAWDAETAVEVEAA